VPAFERDLKGVLSDESDVLNAQLAGFETLHAREPAGRACLAATLGARACPAETLGRIAAAVPVLPRDDHHLAFAIDIDGQRIGVGIFQGVGYRTLMTGSCLKD
jgi:hypothetical protein